MRHGGAVTVDITTCVLSNYDSDGYLVLQGDYYGEQGGQPHEAVFPLGMQARPLDPVTDSTGKVGTGCPMLTFWESDQAMMMPFGDSRVVAGLPALDKGDAMLHGLKAPNFLRLQQDGTCTLYTTVGGTATGLGITMLHGPEGFARDAPWGRETFDVNGYHLTAFSGAAIDLGGIAGLPSPLDQLNSYANLTAASITLSASLVSLGPGGAVQPVALSGPTLAVVSSIVSLLQLLNAPVTGLTTATGGPVTLVPGSPLSAALGGLAAALSAANLAIPSQAVMCT